MGHLSDALLGTLGTLVGAGLIYLATRGRDRATATLSRDQLDEQQRAREIDLIIENLKEQVRDLRADRDGLRAEVARLTRRVGELEQAHGGC